MAATAHRALPVCEWPALGIPLVTSTGSLFSVQQVWWGLYWRLQQGWAGGLWGCGFVGVWRFPEEVAALGNHSAQSPASV